MKTLKYDVFVTVKNSDNEMEVYRRIRDAVFLLNFKETSVCPKKIKDQRENT